VYHFPPPGQGSARGEKKKGPAGCAVSRVLFRRRGGQSRRRRRPFVWTRPCGRALPVGQAAYPRLKRPEPDPRRCLALHPVGFALPATSRPPRCALTAPFHPYPPSPRLRRASPLAKAGEGGMFSVALSLSRCARLARDRDGGCYPPPRFSGARTFLPPPRRIGSGERPSAHPACVYYTRDRPSGYGQNVAGDAEVPSIQPVPAFGRRASARSWTYVAPHGRPSPSTGPARIPAAPPRR